jgi:hypothetical protein
MLKLCKKAAAVGVLGLSVLTAGSVIAQQNDAAAPATGTGTGTTTTRATDRADRDNRGFDMGWLGLIGLAGLAGLMRGDRDRADHRHTPTNVTR